MSRMLMQLGTGGKFYYLTAVHDGYALAHIEDHGDIMRDEQVGEPLLALQVEQQVQYLGLNRNVEGGHWFIANDEGRTDGQCAGDAEALALAPRKRMRIFAERSSVQSDPFEQPAQAIEPFDALSQAMGQESLFQRLSDSQTRIERSVRVLKDHAHGAAQAAKPVSRKAQQVMDLRAVSFAGAKMHFPAGWLYEPKNRSAGGCFTAARFADQAQRLSFINVEGDIIDRRDVGRTCIRGGANPVILLQMADIKQRRIAGHGHEAIQSLQRVS
jgi:hypothetical protein